MQYHQPIHNIFYKANKNARTLFSSSLPHAFVAYKYVFPNNIYHIKRKPFQIPIHFHKHRKYIFSNTDRSSPAQPNPSVIIHKSSLGSPGIRSFSISLIPYNTSSLYTKYKFVFIQCGSYGSLFW